MIQEGNIHNSKKNGKNSEGLLIATAQNLKTLPLLYCHVGPRQMVNAGVNVLDVSWKCFFTVTNCVHIRWEEATRKQKEKTGIVCKS